MEVLKAENLSKIYKSGESAVYALNDVSLTIEEGSFTAITGPSGSGKSTLLHLLSGLDKPTKGKVFWSCTGIMITSCPCCAAVVLALCSRTTIL